MTKQEEEARIAAAVQAQLAIIVAEQQKQFSKMMEKSIKDSLKGADKSNAALKKERDAVLKELDAAKAIHAKAEREADKLAEEYFHGRQKQFREAARTELLRDLTRAHLEAGKKPRDIAEWLDLPLKFVKNIQELLERVSKYGAHAKPLRTHLAGQPKLRYSDYGRGGTIYFESLDTQFDMWWEFAGGDALAIVAVPSETDWETITKLPIETRVATLTWIGVRLLQDKTHGKGRFEQDDRFITLYSS